MVLFFNDINTCISNEYTANVNFLLQNKLLQYSKTNEIDVYEYNIDYKFGTWQSNEEVYFPDNVEKGIMSGFAFNKMDFKTADDILLIINGFFIPAKLYDREDIAKYFSNEKYLHSGFEFLIPQDALKVGRNDCSVIFLDEENKSYCEEPFTLNLMKQSN